MTEAEKIQFWIDMYESFKPAIYVFLSLSSIILIISITLRMIYKTNVFLFLLGGLIGSAALSVFIMTPFMFDKL